ncbi:MAG: hypothetical protein GF317_15635 [Candidatus Lokiarchaeota archaeon]|nr:hypothetical protein [Candidatus Lokiarchaeota archaeon]MBD3200995.1 hypothetical protein [Candidatus Lokiarchaeota archaeon]
MVIIFSDTGEKKRKVFDKFTLNELGGAFGDWGTLIPFLIGYISIVKFNPAGLLICLGLTNVLLGIKFDLPLPVQPQKTIASISIAQRWTLNEVISTGFGTGIVWFVLGFSKYLNKIVSKVPNILVKGIQLGLSFILGWNAIFMLQENILLGVISLVIIISLIKFEKAPSSIILMILGICILLFSGEINIINFGLSFPKIEIIFPSISNILIGMLYAGIGQLLLTMTNVMIATISLVKELFPDRKEQIDANDLATNMGLINLISPFFGGIPLCHGSGGLAAQYAFGARTGGSMIFEGVFEIILALFFSETIFELFINFPMSILAAMLIYTAILLGKIAFSNLNRKKLPIVIISAIFCLVFNIAIGFFIGLGLYLIYKRLKLIDT